MVEHRRLLTAAIERRDGLSAVVGGNGGGLRPSDFAEVQTEIEEEAAGIARCVQGIEELGGQVKDLDRGLVDFPARSDGREVLLCWALGEDEVAYWHGLEEGFAGRQPLPY